MLSFDIIIPPAVETRVAGALQPGQSRFHVVIGGRVDITDVGIAAEGAFVTYLLEVGMERVPMPEAHAAGRVAKVRVGGSASVRVGLALAAGAMVQDNVRNAGDPLRFVGGNGALQLRLGAEFGPRAAILAVSAEIVVIKRVVSHREPATGGFLRDRKPEAVDAIAAGHVFKGRHIGLHGGIPASGAIPINSLHHYSCTRE